MGRRKHVASSESSNDQSNDKDKSSTDVRHATEQSKEQETFDIDEEFRKLFLKFKKKGLTAKDFQKSEILRDIDLKGSYKELFLKYVLIILFVIIAIYLAVLINCLLSWPISNETLVRTWFRWYDSDVESEMCSVYMPEFVSDIFRPPVDCSFCKDLKEVKTLYNISQEEFEQLYAYSGVPVVIGDGTANWTAPKVFSFEFFKDLYKNGSVALHRQLQNCQFFPYQTEFEHLGEVLHMSKERALMMDGSKPWYVGWSNCDFTAGNILRKHYRRPYFLPRLSESSKTDWIFMGSPGYGAHLHIDNVDKSSWQAQITGTKRWTLEPPPECYYTCEDQLQVTVHPGQIIVLDTNIWFHSTLNVGDDISITIGSEYD